MDGAAAAIARIRRIHYPLRFLSNTSKAPACNLHAKLLQCGVKGVVEADIATSLTACRDAVSLARQNPLLILTEEAAVEFQSIKGAVLAPRATEPSLSPEMLASLDAVVIGLAPDRMHYGALDAALQVLIGANSDTHASCTAHRSMPGT